LPRFDLTLKQHAPR